MFFVLPWGDRSLVGTTDVDDATAPERIAASEEDIRYLLEEAARALPELATRGRPLRAFAGLRSLAQGGAILPWANSREHRIIEEGTMLSLIGGKYTTHRSLAERVVDRVVRATRVRAGRCTTAESPRARSFAVLFNENVNATATRAPLGQLRGVSLRPADTTPANCFNCASDHFRPG